MRIVIVPNSKRFSFFTLANNIQDELMCQCWFDKNPINKFIEPLSDKKVFRTIEKEKQNNFID